MNTYVYHIPTGFVMIDTGYKHNLKKVANKLEKYDVALSNFNTFF